MAKEEAIGKFEPNKYYLCLICDRVYHRTARAKQHSWLPCGHSRAREISKQEYSQAKEKVIDIPFKPKRIRNLGKVGINH